METATTDKAKQEWEFVADFIPLLICLIDGQGRILRVNRTIERWGLGSAASVKGRSLHEALHHDCTSPNCPLLGFEASAVPGLVEGRPSHIECIDPLLKRHLAINYQPLLADGTERRLDDARAIVSVDDVSETRQSDKGVLCLQSSLRRCIVQEVAKRLEMEDVQARLLTILSRTPNFIAMADPDGKLFYLNQAGRAMLGVENDCAPDLRLNDCLTAEAGQALVGEVLPGALRQGVWTGPSTLQALDGHRIPTTQVVIVHHGAEGKLVGYSIVEQDMTAWVEAEAALRRSEEELRRISAQLLDVQETERRRIAADLHDVIGQSLSLIKLSIDDTSRVLAEGQAGAAHDALRHLSSKVRDALVEVQRVSMDLRPSTLDDLGILATLSWFFREFEASCRHIRVEKDFRAREENIPIGIKTAIFRILQEATANIVKHAAADRIRVALVHRDESLELTVEDNGRGFDPTRRDDDSPRHGIGLNSMRERARLSGGTYVLESAVGQGTRIQACWPAAPAST